MYLKSLQLIGFKSFAEKTTLEFLPGVTAIVGPNGCGKSNVSDAIRWVLGEQSAKALRGSEMADVIFSGTDGRKAIGMAEVSLTFADVDPSTLSVVGVKLDYSEVTVGRRVYRDGTGEYLINKTPCRLRDVQGLFMDTGIGRSSYSMMAQGQIDQILSARPDDRRNIFEEAAGINKYKHQKKEALRKLEYTEANLVRLTDIIKEVKRQIISLQRQAGKAKRYKELFDELKTLDTRLGRHRYDQIAAELADLEQQIAAIAAQSEQFAAQVGEQETQINELRNSLNQIDRAITDTVNRDHGLKSEHDRHDQRAATNHQRIGEFEGLIEKNNREIAASEEKIRVQEEELARLNAEFDQIDSLLAAEQQTLQGQQETLRQLEADLSEKDRAHERSKSTLFELESQVSRHRNELASLDQRKKQDVLRGERLSTERIELEDQRQQLVARLQEFNASLAQLRSAIENLQQGIAERTEAGDGIARELTEVTGLAAKANHELSQKRARLDVLRQFFAAPDGRSTLGNILEVDQQFAAAIEAALNHNLRIILADDMAAACGLLQGNFKNPMIAAASEVRDQRSEVRDQRSAVPAVIAGLLADPLATENVVRANNVVRVADPRFTKLLQALLANVVIATDLDAALAFQPRHPELAVATQQGEFVSVHGVLSKVSESHIVEIGALTEAVKSLSAQSDELAARQTRLQAQKSALDQELDSLRAEFHQNEIEVASKTGELRTVDSAQRETDNKLHTVTFELSRLEEQSTEDQQRHEQLLESIRADESREGELRDEMVRAQQAVQELRAQRQAAADQVTEQRILVGGIQHKRQSIEGQRNPITGRVRDLRERMEDCAHETGNHCQRIEELRAEISESDAKKLEIEATRQEIRAHLDGLQHQRSEVATGIQQAETELRALRTQAAEAQQQKSGFTVAIAQKQMETQNIKERVWQKYQVNIDDIRPDAYNVTVADQGVPLTEQVPFNTDWDSIEQQVTEMQTRLDAMGPVNVEAIQEYDELEERYQFLSQQHEDLIKAKEQLLQVIAKINTTTKQLFVETFEKVRDNFQLMFVELFGGGKANLVLLDENDVLESGIEIVAKPPGKQLQSITLLSGGERTLTATALLFAIYLVKPSPFCVLDELDAPLDESNINRFIRILQRFVEMSQFVVITHNKRTIGMADALYGITMEEHGVSKVVSVKFSPRDEATRKQQEKAREAQEDRIDGAAVVAAGPVMRDTRPHEEDLGNQLLTNKEKTVAPLTEPEAMAMPAIHETEAGPEEIVETLDEASEPPAPAP